jgi:hypothetical protein
MLYEFIRLRRDYALRSRERTSGELRVRWRLIKYGLLPIIQLDYRTEVAFGTGVAVCIL